jgi:DNA polymerase III subunit chi
LTRIDFIFNVESKTHQATQVLHTQLKKGRQVTVHVASETEAHALSDALWGYDAVSFLPHCLVTDSFAKETPVLIHWPQQALLQHDVLINFQAITPIFFSRFGRLVEIVGLDEQDKRQARERFKFYRDRGYEIKTHDVSKL